ADPVQSSFIVCCGSCCLSCGRLQEKGLLRSAVKTLLARSRSRNLGRAQGISHREHMRTELHTHLLPGVDDGPASDAESLELARMAVADGTRTVVATPHVSMVDISELPARVGSLRGKLDDAGVPLAVHQGGELSPRDVYGIGRYDLDAIAQGP